jgi:hypothetical protein
MHQDRRRIRLTTKILSGAAAVTLAATAMTALSATAQASTASAPPTAGRTVLVVPAGATVTATAGGSHVRIVGSPTVTATCNVSPSTPFRYYGGPYGGGEEGIAQIFCNAVVSELFIEVALFTGSGTQLTYNSNTAYSVAQITADTEYPVAAGYYFTGADGTQYNNGTSTPVNYAQSSTVYLCYPPGGSAGRGAAGPNARKWLVPAAAGGPVEREPGGDQYQGKQHRHAHQSAGRGQPGR